MPFRPIMSQLNASSYDILNTIRDNAPYDYQDLIPEVTNLDTLRAVGQSFDGAPSAQNYFVNALINRIAQVNVKAATFNNAYAMLKKGFLQYGETVEEVFVSITKARPYDPEKAPGREFKRTLPDVKSSFHLMNWRVQYPLTIQPEDLRMCFLSENGIVDFIAKLTGQLLTAQEYDEFLLFKYLIIKACSHGKVGAEKVDDSNLTNFASAFRGVSNMLTFMKHEYNAKGVLTTTPKADQYIFMDARFAAKYDVEVLAAAFNMDKAEFSGRLVLIDDFSTFDNDRFDVIREESDMIEEVTADELNAMKKVKALLVDKEWFQVYDNLNKMTSTEVASGLYWNYFWNVWKTVDTSVFSNAVMFVTDDTVTTLPDSITVEVTSKSVGETATVLTLTPDDDNVTMAPTNYKFITTQDSVEKGIAIHPYGALIIPALSAGTVPVMEVGGTLYQAGTSSDSTITPVTVTGAETVGTELTFYKKSAFAG